MAEEIKTNQVMTELCDQASYAMRILGASREAREFLITGICPECFESMGGDEDDD